jgi:hypothetical protein
MIICNLNGGLGNQMFQYAHSRMLSAMLQKELVIATDCLEKNFNGIKRKYELADAFNIPIKEIEISNLKSFPWWMKSPQLRLLLSKKIFNFILPSTFITEENYSPFNNKNLTQCLFYIHGYWQNIKYFDSVSELIRKDFIFPKFFDTDESKLLDKIKSQSSVGIHVRRGDYLNSPKHYSLSIKYYLDSVKYIRNINAETQAFIFSDDKQWVADNLIKLIPNSQIVNLNAIDQSWKEMRLMSTTDHQIIANSSFSWWAAWLNNSPNKVVIGPKIWFPNEEKRNQVLPKSWISM